MNQYSESLISSSRIQFFQEEELSESCCKKNIRKIPELGGILALR